MLLVSKSAIPFAIISIPWRSFLTRDTPSRSKSVSTSIRLAFLSIGRDEGDLPALQEAITKLNLDSHVKYEGTLSQGSAVERLAQAGVFVLPSFGEVFPMTVLESLVAGTPVVTTDQSGLAGLLTRWNAAIVTDGSPQQLMEAVSKILTDPKERKILTSNGSMAVEEEFSIDIVANQLSRMYLASNK